MARKSLLRHRARGAAPVAGLRKAGVADCRSEETFGSVCMKLSNDNGAASPQCRPARTLTKNATHFIAFLLFKVLVVLAFVGGCYAAG